MTIPEKSFKHSPLTDLETMQGYSVTMARLEPIKKEAGWKGRGVFIGESIRRKCNQIIELFKTGKWAVEDQVCVKIQRDLEEVNKLTSSWSAELKKWKKDKYSGEAGELVAASSDQKMRYELGQRLNLMHVVLLKALDLNKMSGGVKMGDSDFVKFEPSVRRLAVLENIIGKVINENKQILKEEAKIIKKSSELKKLVKERAATKEKDLHKDLHRVVEKAGEELFKTAAIHKPPPLKSDLFEMTRKHPLRQALLDAKKELLNIVHPDVSQPTPSVQQVRLKIEQAVYVISTAKENDKILTRGEKKILTDINKNLKEARDIYKKNLEMQSAIDEASKEKKPKASTDLFKEFENVELEKTKPMKKKREGKDNLEDFLPKEKIDLGPSPKMKLLNDSDFVKKWETPDRLGK